MERIRKFVCRLIGHKERVRVELDKSKNLFKWYECARCGVRIDLEGPGKVISIEVARKSRWSRHVSEECSHGRIQIDSALAKLLCMDCGKELNPIGWLVEAVEEWGRVRHLTEEYNKAVLEYRKRSRVKCRHCGQMTPV